MITAEPLVDWGRAADMKGLIFSRLLEHFELTFLAIGIGLLISLPLGVYAYRHRWFYGPVSGVAGILYTVPSLALFGFLIPFTGLTVTSAEIGLVSYTLLILIRNIVGGLNAVPADAREAARGMGYSDMQLLVRVEFPIALPVILAGIRLATVTIIGLVTVTALIGYGGLGHFILLGFRQFDTTLSFIGGMLSLLLAVAIDAALVGVERVVTPWTRRRSGKALAT